MQRKVRIHWQSDEGLVQKVRRFDEKSIEANGHEHVGHELVELFPLIKCKGLRLELSYEDCVVGKVTIDGDVTMKSALTAFSEEEDLSLLHLHASIHGKTRITNSTRQSDFR